MRADKSAVRGSAVRESAVRGSAVRGAAVRESAVPESAVQVFATLVDIPPVGFDKKVPKVFIEANKVDL